MKAMNGRLVAIAILLMVLTACGADPRREAAAYETRVIADQTAANMEQARAIEAQQEAERAAAAAYRQQVWDASIETAKSMGKFFIAINAFVLTLAVAFVVGSGAFTVRQTVAGVGDALVLKAMTQAALIHMDKSTRTFPSLITEMNGTKFLTNQSTGQTWRLDKETLANPHMIAMLAQVAATGAALQEMKGAKDAGGMAIFQPEIIEASTERMTVGKNIRSTLNFVTGRSDDEK